MLRVMTYPRNKTDVMYEAVLSYTQLTRYLAFLEEKRLIEQTGGKWVISQTGRDYLNAYSIVEQLVLV